MHRTRPDETTIQISISAEARAALETLATVENITSVDELVCRLLSNYCHQNGIDVDFGIAGETLKSQEADETLMPKEVKIADEMLQVFLTDGRIMAHPLAWYPWLAKATPEQFANRIVSPIAIYWPDLEDGLSIETLIKGPPRRTQVAF